MGTACAKAFGDVLRVNKTMQHLNVSNNSFGRPVLGDQVKLKSSGEVCTVMRPDDAGVFTDSAASSQRKVKGYFVDGDYEWESQVPAFCAGLAASSSLLSVSNSMWCRLICSLVGFDDTDMTCFAIDDLIAMMGDALGWP